MIVPVVSRETRQAVIAEFYSYEYASQYYNAMRTRLEAVEEGGDGLNPVISKLLFNILNVYKDRRMAEHMVTFGFMVYRAIEMTMGTENIPKLDDHIGAPIQQEYLNDPKGCSQSLSRRVAQENTQISMLCVDLCGLLVTSNDPKEKKIPSMAMAAGMMVYRFLESQMEADQMKQSFL